MLIEVVQLQLFLKNNLNRCRIHRYCIVTIVTGHNMPALVQNIAHLEWYGVQQLIGTWTVITLFNPILQVSKDLDLTY